MIASLKFRPVIVIGCLLNNMDLSKQQLLINQVTGKVHWVHEAGVYPEVEIYVFYTYDLSDLYDE